VLKRKIREADSESTSLNLKEWSGYQRSVGEKGLTYTVAHRILGANAPRAYIGCERQPYVEGSHFGHQPIPEFFDNPIEYPLRDLNAQFDYRFLWQTPVKKLLLVLPLIPPLLAT
jgi:hypothetical protein